VGLLLLAGLVGYMIYAYRQERLQPAGAGADHTAAFDRAEAVELTDPALRPHAPDGTGGLMGWLVPFATALVGLGIIIFGGRLLVDAAVDLARTLGMSEAVIGLTIVAVGTSMPELVTSVVAAFKRQADVALGNILGSNIYNTLGIGGTTALLAPTSIPAEMVRFDIPVMIGASLLLLLFAWTGRRLSRGEGAIFLGFYAAYLAWLIAGVN
jgi:cation:H+ antiporter